MIFFNYFEKLISILIPRHDKNLQHSKNSKGQRIASKNPIDPINVSVIEHPMETQLVTTRTIGSSQAPIPNSIEMGKILRDRDIAPLVNNNNLMNVAQNAWAPNDGKPRPACFAALDLYYSNEHDDSADYEEAALPLGNDLHTNASANDWDFYRQDNDAPNAKRMRVSFKENEKTNEISRQVQWSSRGQYLANIARKKVNK